MRQPFSAALAALALPLAGSTLVTACFVEARPVEELFDVAVLSTDRCSFDWPDVCHDGNPCTRDECASDWGFCFYAPDDVLIPDDGQGCTIDVCEDGVARHEPAPAGTPCGANGALACDGNGACVGCGGDAALCGQPTLCLGWSCEGDTCAPDAAPAGLPLPPDEQIPADCSVRECDGLGGMETFRGDDPMVWQGDPCRQIDCFTYQNTQRPVGAVCNRGCAASGSVEAATVLTCDASGACVPTGTEACGIGYQCGAGECATSCTPATVGADCVYPTQCIDGRCVHPAGDVLGDCQASCAAFTALGCPSDPDGPTCEQACLAVAGDSFAPCFDAARVYIGCLGETAPTATSCAEHRTACLAEYKLFAECQNIELPSDPGCSPLPCAAGFEGCLCAAYCGGELYADHCVPAEDGTFTCTCAKDGATVATCEGQAGCGVAEGCCKNAL